MSTLKSSILKWIEKCFQWVEEHQAAITVIVTVLTVIATVFIMIFNGLLWSVTLQMAEIDQQLTKVTGEYYEYHPPKVTVTYGQVTKLYVLRNESCGTYISLIGLAHVYNSGIANDIAVIQQKGRGSGYDSAIQTEENGMIAAIVDFEGSPYPVPLSPGAFPTEMPILITAHTDKVIELNSTIELIIEKEYARLEVIHPINKKLIDNITSLESIDITYNIGKETADAETADGGMLIMDVRYTDNIDTYMIWKKTFMYEHGIKGALYLIDPRHK